jgi:F-box and WD-40 domain protein 1/11
VISSDFIRCLPEELAIYILTLCDDIQSILRVSRLWHGYAQDRDVWKALYRRRYGLGSRQRIHRPVPRDWKDVRMLTQLFRQRLRLARNWTDGSFTSAHITGHRDSVYCIQYDADKIVSGSRWLR